MSTEKKISGSMFGYKKADVNDYIATLSENFRKQELEKTRELDALSEKNAELLAKIATLTDKVYNLEEKNIQLNEKLTLCNSEKEELAKQQAVISQAILKAQSDAEEIRLSAENSIQSKRLEAERQLKLETERAERVRADVVALQKLAVRTIKSFESQLAALSGKKAE